jgi:hypothetical protein
MKNITTISLPPDLKAVAKRNGSHRGIPKLSTYIQYLIAQDDHMIQDAKRAQVGKNLPRIDYAKFPRPTLEDLGLTEADVINSMSKDELINFIYKVGNKVSYCGFQESVNEKGLELVWERERQEALDNQKRSGREA